MFYILATTEALKTILDLSAEISFTHVTIDNVVRKLEHSEFVNVQVHPTDGCSKHITLSVKGLSLFLRLQKVWLPLAAALKSFLDVGHPNFLNIINRIEPEVSKSPIYEKMKKPEQLDQVQLLDCKPSLKRYFYELAGNWLLGLLKGTLEKEDEFTLHSPDKAYLEAGGYLFFVLHKKQAVGCVALNVLMKTLLNLRNCLSIQM